MPTYAEITYSEFRRRCCVANVQAISVCCRPTVDEHARTSCMPLSELLDDKTYTCRCANGTFDRFVCYCSPDAVPTLFLKLLECSTLLSKLNEENRQHANCPLDKASVVSLHCSGCDRRVIIDGTHRLARLGSEKKFSAPICILELSGARWPSDTPDLNLVCICDRTLAAQSKH